MSTPQAQPHKSPIATPLLALTLAITPVTQSASWMISGNENKLDLTSGAAKVVPNAEPDSITLLDFAKFPPAVSHLPNIPNTVIGPPSNIAIHPSGQLALIANSVEVDPQDPAKTTPTTQIHILDLSLPQPAILGEVHAGKQPSGISFTPDGKFALVANRADGTISVVEVSGKQVRVKSTVQVCAQELSISDVAIHPNGKLALASIQKGGYLQTLSINSGVVRTNNQQISVYGNPYRCVITPDGAFGLTAGQGAGNGLDSDALTVVDLQGPNPRTVDYVPLAAVPESIEISPDGQLVAAVLMNGSNLPANHPNYNPHGLVALVERQANSFRRVQLVPVGRIPEGVAFSPDGKYLVVQCHPDRKLWVLNVKQNRLEDAGVRIDVPGMPSSLRAAY
ncbi:MAG: hypothetical protein RI897_1171 [Verrucomicrobiota bacterium]|jgi:DNA-binding beta-propeller fold protein YncE